MSLPLRRGRGSPLARRRGPARASAARRSADRAAALMVLLVALVALGGLCASATFRLSSGGLVVRGTRFTDPAAVRTALGLQGASAPNLVTLRTADLEAALRRLPAVDAARADAVAVRVALPDRLIVTLREREPILLWEVGTTGFLVDGTGTLFAAAPVGSADPGLPAVLDGRTESATLGVGDHLDPSDLEAARRLAALTPGFLGSSAAALSLAVTDDEGFTLDARPSGWHVVFGFYTASIRPPTLVDGQAQCLASLLGGREATLGTVYLAPGGDRCGTFTIRAARASSAPSSPLPPAPSATP